MPVLFHRCSIRRALFPCILFVLAASFLWVYHDTDPAIPFPCNVFFGVPVKCGALQFTMYHESDFRAFHDDRHIQIERTGCWNPPLIRMVVFHIAEITKQVQRRPNVMEIDANSGLLSQIAIQLGASVFAVDPLPVNINILSCSKHYDTRAQHHLTITRAVVSNQPGMCSVFSTTLQPYRATLDCREGVHEEKNWEGSKLAAVTATKTVEQIVKQTKLDMVIIDSWDADYAALQSVLTENSTVQNELLHCLFLNFTPWRILQRSLTIKSIFQLLLDHGFQAYTIEGEVITESSPVVQQLIADKDSMWLIARKQPMNLKDFDFDTTVKWLQAQGSTNPNKEKQA